MIIEGDYGSGRLTLSHEISTQLNATEIIAENTIDSVRQVIKNAYTITSPVVYIFRDCDGMSLAAKNSLLKVVEEPPNKAYFIMTVRDKSNMLPTIISRATVLTMSPYTQDELKFDATDSNIAYMIKTIADNTEARKIEFRRTIELCDNVITYIEKRSMLGVLKELNRLQAKSDDSGVSPELFIRAFRHNICKSALPDEIKEKAVPHISKCSYELTKAAINSKASVELMCINIVEDYKAYAEVQS